MADSSPPSRDSRDEAPRPSRSIIGRLGPRVVVFPVIVLVVAWMLQTRNAGVEEQRVATIRADVERLIAAAAAGERWSEDVSESVPGILDPAMSLVGDLAADPATGRLTVAVTQGDDGPGPPSAATHTATIREDGSPRLHLRVGVTGDRTVLAGWWRPAASP